ncbi:MAG: molybdenum ABC transporter ATP-binding protein [Pseudomonadales bacterium]|nr:molybdenum ABC transporter ATP-binding protein [Pseudomonadales bacterium]
MQIHADIHLERDSGFTVDADLRIRDSGITALYGPSGSGKSTMLRLIAGLERGRKGDRITITADDETWHDRNNFVPVHRRGVGFVFQQQQLFPHLTVRGNLDYAIKRRHSDNGVDLSQIKEWLGLAPLLPQPVQQLSGGEAQRVSIARVLLSGARCILMDEPLGSIDVASRARILPYLDRLHRNLRLPLIYVSHSLEEITYLADELYLLDDGKIKASGSLFELASSLELNIDAGEAAASVLQCTIAGHEADYGLTRLDFDGCHLFVTARHREPGATLRVRIPARDVSITLEPPQQTSILNVIPTTVEEIQPPTESPGVLVRLGSGKQHILARITRKSLNNLNLTVGQQVYAQIKSVALLSDYED